MSLKVTKIVSRSANDFLNFLTFVLIGAGDSLRMFRTDSITFELLLLVPSTLVIKSNCLFLIELLISTSFDHASLKAVTLSEKFFLYSSGTPAITRSNISFSSSKDAKYLTDSVFITEGCHPKECALRRASSIECSKLPRL